MKWTVILIIAMLGALLSGAAYTWTDDFESYTSGLVLPSPWVNSNIHVLGGYGVGQGAARYGYGEWDKFSEYRPTADPGTVLKAQIYNAAATSYPPYTLDYSISQVGLSSGPIAGSGQLENWSNPVNYLSVIALHADARASNNLYFDVTNQDGSVFSRTAVTDLTWDQWYDVKIVVSGSASTGYYRPTGAADWISLGSYTQPAGFAGYNYVGITSSRFGTIDNISWGSPGPGVIAGNVSLENFTAGGLPVAVRIQLIKSSVVVRTEDVMLGADGGYTLSNVTPDTYTVAFKASQFLRKAVPNVAVTSDATTPCSVTLMNGDVNGDNSINNTDVSNLVPNLDQGGD